ncbi:MAG: hypothetical protein ACTSR8_13375 [Promethearchaeota archaeon]
MPYLKKSTIFFDLAHNEMLNPEDEEYSEFLYLLERSNVRIKKNVANIISEILLSNVDILILGNPVGDYFSRQEIKAIVDYIREGGSCLVLTEYGSDLLHKTNLNDLVGKYFGIFLEKDIIKETNNINRNCSSILSIENFEKHRITDQLREVIIGGSCSLIVNKFVDPLLLTSNSSWSEIFDEHTLQPIKEQNIPSYIIAACTEYGKGKVVVIGDIDILTNDFINRLDNRKFVLNVLEWLTEPVKDSDVMTFMLNQLGAVQSEIREMNNKINNIIETITILEKRVSSIEEEAQETVKKKEYKREFEDKTLEERTFI